MQFFILDLKTKIKNVPPPLEAKGEATSIQGEKGYCDVFYNSPQSSIIAFYNVAL